MAINEFNVVLYQDYKRNTATSYLKFPNKKDEIYMGYCLDEVTNDYILSKSSKSKLERCYIEGISSAISFWSDKRVHMSVYVDGETYYLFLMPTDDYPITHKGHWVRKQLFSDWIEQSDKVVRKTAKDFFGE